MSPGDYLLLAAVATGLAFFVAASSWKQPRKAEPPREVTRWKRFRVTPNALGSAHRDPACVVMEEPKGMKLLVVPRHDAGSRRTRIATADGKMRIDIARKWHLFRRRFQVSLAGRAWLRLDAPRRNPTKIALSFASPPLDLQLRGDPKSREYQIVSKGRLVANVSWQSTAKEEASCKEYILETVKTEDAVPMVALALALDVALS